MAVPVALTISIEDGKGDVGSFSIYLPSASTLAQVQTYWAGIDSLIAAIVRGGNITASVSFPLTPLVSGPLASSDVQEAAYAAFRSAEGFIKSIRIPTIFEDVFLAGSKLVDLANVDIAAFVTAITTGLSGVAPVTSHDEDLLSLDIFREAWGKFRP
jgi:hypothetical protein